MVLNNKFMAKNTKIIFVAVAIIILIDIFYLVKFYTSQNINQLPKNEATQTTTIANPASTNCVENGGTVVIKEKEDGSQYGLCYFDDNRACEEWAMLRGDCPVGGRKTTGYDTIAQSFCAWSGGQTFAVENAVCTFNDGSTCLADDFYSGTCQKGENK